MRIVFIGAVEFSRRALLCLAEKRAEIVGVCTVKESHFNSDQCDLGPACEKLKIPWIYAPDINSDETIRWVANQRPDVILCFGWSRLLRKPMLDLAPLGVVGFHPAALPANRGRHPLVWALVLGLKETASTFFLMDEGTDSGDILSQMVIPIEDTDNATTLYEKVTLCALSQIEDLLPQLASRSFRRVPQDSRKANAWRKRGHADGKIDWRMSARSIRNLVRGLAKPYVGAHLVYHGHEFKVWSAELVEDVPPNLEPGRVVQVSERGPVVKCGDMGIALTDTEPLFWPLAGEYL